MYNECSMSKILEKLSLVPSSSGVYVMRNSAGHVIYVGKAKVLKNRLGSYFHQRAHDAKTTAMLQNVADFEYYVVSTEKDALGLEANLIKKHKPHYNILLKDNKTFPYIKITGGAFPCLEITRKTGDKHAKYFGPYFNGIWARDLLRTIHDIFPVRACSGNVKCTMNNVQCWQKEACMNFQIGRCSAPCCGKIDKDDYVQIINQVKSFLRGENDHGAHGALTAKMNNASDLAQFELAIRYRDSIRFLDKLKERTITQVASDVNADIFGSAAQGDVFVVSVLTVRAGKLIGVQNFANKDTVGEDQEALSTFIMQYYTENIVPELIVAEHALDDVAEILGCKVFNPQRALKKKLLDMANQNAMEYLSTSIEKIEFKTQFTLGACEELATTLGLAVVPKKIECYDISHYGGDETVASMVVFINGVAERKLYRKFKIRTVEGVDDCRSMQEVLGRRLRRLGSADESFGTPPDLIIVDGGKGQLSSALLTLENYKQITNDEFRMDLISLAERNEEIFVPNNSEPVVLPKRSYALRLVQRVRDEAHRFAVTFQRSRRAKGIKR
jgi:excinuclease ABC subunit C